MLNWFRSTPRPTVPEGQRVYAVGDVHGRADLLDDLLAILERDDTDRGAAQTTLVLLGDLIDRGPDSRRVVARVQAGVPWATTIALMGNHEAVMLDVLDGRTDTIAQWLRFGGRETLESWGVPRETVDRCTNEELVAVVRDAVTPKESAWLGTMRTSLRIGNYYFVHAGIRPTVPLDDQSNEDRLWIRKDFLHSRRQHGAMIVHGHSIARDVEERPNRIGLDTGAYATGKLTAIGLEGADRWFLQTDGASLEG